MLIKVHFLYLWLNWGYSSEFLKTRFFSIFLDKLRVPKCNYPLKQSHIIIIIYSQTYTGCRLSTRKTHFFLEVLNFCKTFFYFKNVFQNIFLGACVCTTHATQNLPRRSVSSQAPSLTHSSFHPNSRGVTSLTCGGGSHLLQYDCHLLFRGWYDTFKIKILLTSLKTPQSQNLSLAQAGLVYA